MKITIGTKVSGEVTVGHVVAMSKQWCIYVDKNGEELAEPWDVIQIEYDRPTEAVSSITEK